MDQSISRFALLIACVISSSLPAGTASAETQTVYLGTITDDRVERCGVNVSSDQIARIQPFFSGQEDLDGQLEIRVTKRDPSGQSLSRQASSFVGGKLGMTTISILGPAEAAIVLSVTDRSGETLCAMRRSIVLGSIPLKI